MPNLNKMNYGKVGSGVYHSIALLLFFFLSGCSKKSLEKKKITDIDLAHDSFEYKQTVMDTIIQQEAMLVNVPLPLYDERIILDSSFDEDQGVVLGYKSPLTVEQVIAFFMNEMERYGWKHLVTFYSSESILQFQSPHFYCTVLTQSLENRYSRIIIYMKKASTDARFE
jgi:hypothetical protein